MLKGLSISTKLYQPIFLLVSVVLLTGSFLYIDQNVASESSITGEEDNADFDELNSLGDLVGETLDFDRTIEKEVFVIPAFQETEPKINPDIPSDQIDTSIRAQLIGVQQQVDPVEANGSFSEVSDFLGTTVSLEFENGTLPISKGEYFFVGIGNWNQGHGLGFSQYGAKGGAENGISGNQIAKYYFPGSKVVVGASGTVKVEGYGTMDVEDYLAGIGEIPDKACGTAEQVALRPDKFVLPNPNLWENGCWPEDAIKAQMIVSRSYALAYGGTICTSAACQVYKGGTAKKWAADVTEGIVLKYNNEIIKAYFSSDNNNGWGSGTHRKPMWCWDMGGNCGEGFPWLQSVYDNDFAAPHPEYDNYIYRSNGYSLSDFNTMLNWYSNNGWESALKTYAGIVKSTVGNITAFSATRDPSCRVHKLQIIGTTGQIDFNGDKFTGMYNEWVWRTDPSGQHAANGNYDFISSLTYYVVKAPRNYSSSDLSFVNFSYGNCSVSLEQPSDGEFLPI